MDSAGAAHSSVRLLEDGAVEEAVGLVVEVRVADLVASAAAADLAAGAEQAEAGDYSLGGKTFHNPTGCRAEK